MTQHYAESIDIDKGIFKVFEDVLVHLKSPYPMQFDDFKENDTKGTSFRFFDKYDGEIIEIASITIADVTADKTEPDITILTQDDIPIFDAQLLKACSDGLPIQGMTLDKWMGSQLNGSSDKKELITAYTVYQNGIEYQFIAIRLKANSKKIVAVGTFIVERADELAKPIFGILQNIKIIPQYYESSPTIRQIIHNDFGIDIPLERGKGDIAEPYKLSIMDRYMREFYQLQLINCISRGRGLYWRTLSKDIITQDSRILEKFTIETIKFNEIQKFDGTLTFYFETTESHRSSNTNCILMMDTPHHGLLLPFEIGWLHFHYFTNYEEKQPGLGFSAAYSAPKIEATLYLYDKKLKHISDDLNDALVQAEFEKANADITERLPEAEQSWSNSTNQRLMRIYQVDPKGLNLTCIILSTSNNHFIKIRISWQTDREQDTMVMDFIDKTLNSLRFTRH